MNKNIMFNGRLWKDIKSSWWLVEVPNLDLITQGRTRKDAIMVLLHEYFDLYENFRVIVSLYRDGKIGIKASDNTFLLTLGEKRRQVNT